MTAPVFVDSNVLVYWLDVTEPDKQRDAEGWLKHLWTHRAGRISYQILLEFYVIVTQKIDRPLDHEEARTVVRTFLAWRPVETNHQTIAGAWAVQDRYRLSWWDSLIVSAAQSLQCSYLLSEDLQHGQDLGGVRVVDPFKLAPVDLAKSERRRP